MRKSFSSILGAGLGAGTGQFKLRVFLLVLLLLNAAAFYFYFDPPGGSQQELAEQDRQIKSQIAALNAQDSRLKLMAGRVETGSMQITDFEKRYFLPKRMAYSDVIEELQRMAKISGLQARDAGLSEEPIEGTTDLSLMNIKATYEGSYPSLIRFLYETDRSPMLLMLYSLTAAPEAKNAQIIADIRFQVVIQDQPYNEQLTNYQTSKESGPETEAPAAEVRAVATRAVPTRPAQGNSTQSKAGQANPVQSGPAQNSPVHVQPPQAAPPGKQGKAKTPEAAQ